LWRRQSSIAKSGRSLRCTLGQAFHKRRGIITTLVADNPRILDEKAEASVVVGERKKTAVDVSRGKKTFFQSPWGKGGSRYG
jgi:hypothetical protein